MTSPRLRKRKFEHAWVVKTLLGVAFLVLTTSCALNVTLKLVLCENPSEANRSLLEQESSYPGAFIDLWPDDQNTEGYHKTLRNCIPGLDDHCQIKLQKKVVDDTNDNPQQQATVLRVALVRPPGLLGDVFVEYMHKVLQLDAEHNYAIELVPTSEVIDANHNYSLILRFAILPPLLDACDTALKLLGTQKFSLEELMDFVRSAIRFQCHITQRTNDTPLFTVTLDRMVGFSTSTVKKLQKFLSITPNPEAKKNRVELKDLPLVVMDRVSTASELVTSIAPIPVVISTLSRVVEEEVLASQNNGACRPLIHIGGKEQKQQSI